MVRVTETDQSKVNSHHRYTGAVRVDFPMGEETVDVDEDVAAEAVSTYETVEYADDVDEASEDATEDEATTATRQSTTERKKAQAQTQDTEAEADADANAEAEADARESRAPHVQNDDAEAEAEAAGEDEPTRGEAP